MVAGIGVCAALLAPARSARAQAGSASEADILLVPSSARVVGLGGAGVAAPLGGEGLLLNPAAIAWLTNAELALLYGQDLAGERLALAYVRPSGRVGTFGVLGSLSTIYEEPALDEFGTQTGEILVRAVHLDGTYASTLGKRLSLGLTYRVWQYRYDCSGVCTQPGQAPLKNATTTMIDLGAQYRLPVSTPVTVGASLRHLGPRVQVKDEQQSGPLPTRVAVGFRAEVPAVARRVPGVELRVLGDATKGIGGGGTYATYHLGVEGAVQRAFLLRAGWTQQPQDAGPSVGFSFERRRLGFDVGRRLGGFSVESGEPPTFVSLRYRF